jgi:hypothetical protein
MGAISIALGKPQWITQSRSSARMVSLLNGRDTTVWWKLARAAFLCYPPQQCRACMDLGTGSFTMTALASLGASQLAAPHHHAPGAGRNWLMRTVVVMLGALLILVTTLTGSLAQDATSPVEDTSPGPSVDPTVGETVTYMDARGEPIAYVTIEEVMRGWQDDDELDESDSAVEYLAFIITIESAVTRGTVEVSEFDFTLHDGAGFLWGASFADVAAIVEEAGVAPLGEDVSLASGDAVTILIVFEVLQGQPLAHLFWQPDTGRLITLASLEGR